MPRADTDAQPPGWTAAGVANPALPDTLVEIRAVACRPEPRAGPAPTHAATPASRSRSPASVADRHDHLERSTGRAGLTEREVCAAGPKFAVKYSGADRFRPVRRRHRTGRRA